MELRQQALAWMAEDPDPATREEVQRLLDLDDDAGLADRFSQRLEFGTAGIRGPLGAGPNRMNRAMIRRVTAGLAERLNQVAGPAGAQGVVVGRDARYNSDEFAADATRVLAGAGLGVWEFVDVVPTPLVAFAVRYLKAAAGVMITASHNPPSDNGFKVYGPGGRQIAAPLDAEISAAIDAVESLDDVPLAPPDTPLVWPIAPDLVENYVHEVLQLIPSDGPKDTTIVYSALHGVAGELCLHILSDAGFTDVHAVPEQQQPNPDFPTVAFPNPEEPGAMDLAVALATEIGADLILANDPDGDRIAVGIPQAGQWRLLGGDEIGTMLAEDVLSRGALAGAGAAHVATTVVSSQLLAKIAADHHAGYTETLTGFKWLSQAAAEVAEDGQTMVLAYEQALGVSIGDLVRDKDGISAALAVADLAARLRHKGQTIDDLLDDLARRHGAHVTEGRSIHLDDSDGEDQVQAALDRLRADPPAELGGSDVVRVWDHDAGVVTAQDGSVEEIGLPPTPLLRYVAADGTRVMVRPSGTEPKLKFYGEAIVAGEDPDAAREQAAARVGEVLDTFMARTLPGQKVS